MQNAVWAHAVNSMEEFRAALAPDSKFNAIEADLSWNSVHNCAVMKHAATSNTSELAEECLMEDWLDFALQHASAIQIIKLDFKNMKAVRPSIDKLLKAFEREERLGFQVFLNADILHGPGSHGGNAAAAALPIPSKEFVRECARLPNATLSLGWTTKWTLWGENRYLEAHCKEMLDFIAEEDLMGEKITFPIRASFALDSWPELKRVLEVKENFSLTLWTANEGVPQTDLDFLQREHEVGLNNRILYVDCDKGPKHARWHPARLKELAMLVDWKELFAHLF